MWQTRPAQESAKPAPIWRIKIIPRTLWLKRPHPPLPSSGLDNDEGPNSVAYLLVHGNTGVDGNFQ